MHEPVIRAKGEAKAEYVLEDEKASERFDRDVAFEYCQLLSEGNRQRSAAELTVCVRDV